MRSTAPDVVLRTAERIRSANVRTAAAPEAEKMGAPEPGLESSGSSGVPPRTRVVVSPAILASNGIHLPSGDPATALVLEEYRSIRRNVLANLLRPGQKASANTLSRIVLVTSAKPGDGKTFTSINLALSIALAGERKVILMDGDAHRRCLLEYMGIHAELGWADLLARDELGLSDVLLETNINNLTVLPSGKPSPGLPDLIAGKKMVGLLAQLHAYEPNAVVVIDSLPCLVSNEPAILAEFAGQVVFVVAAYETGRDEVLISLRQLAAAPLVSLVLNKGEPLLAERFSRYGYYGQNQPAA